MGALTALTSGCDGVSGNGQQPATRTASAVDCPDIPSAAPAKDSFRAEQTMIGQPMKIPAAPPPVQVVVTVKCLGPNTIIAKHRHPWQRYVYLETGTVTVTFDAPVPQVKSFKAGDLLVESTDTWHTAQVGPDGPAKLIVIDQVPATNPPTPNQIEWSAADEKAATAPAGK
jgi:quercetin dioxygenase-like cupin family protein